MPIEIVSIFSGFVAWGSKFVNDWGYFGIFFISMISTASLLPIPYFILVFGAGAILNPVVVGIAGGLGAAIGQQTSYILGFGGEKLLKKKHEKMLKDAEVWAEKHGFFLMVVVFAATPLPDTIIGIIGGALGYDIKKFFIATLIGKLALNLALAFAGFYGFSFLLKTLGGF